MSIRRSHLLVALLAMVAVIGLVFWQVLAPSATGPTGPARVSAAAMKGRSRGWGAVQGVVKVRATNRPAAGVRVRVSGKHVSAGAVTSASGAFSVRVPCGLHLSVHLGASAGLAQATVRRVDVQKGETRDLGVLYLVRGGRITGTVVDERGRPVAGAVVEAHEPGEMRSLADVVELSATLKRTAATIARVTSKKNGAFALPSLAAGPYELVARHPGFAAGVLPRFVVGPGGHPRARLVLARGERLAGTVKTWKGDAVPGATVAVLRPSTREPGWTGVGPSFATTDADGAFAFGSLRPGLAILCAKAAGYPVAAELVRIGKDRSVTIEVGGAGTVKGRITGPKGKGIVGARVIVVVHGVDALASTTSGAGGRYEVGHLKPGPLQAVSVRAKGFAPYPSLQQLGSMSAGLGDVKAGATLEKDVQLVRGQTIAGRVTDSLEGRPIAGAKVELISPMTYPNNEPARPATTDEHGRFVVRNVAVGAYAVVARKPGYVERGLNPSDPHNALSMLLMPSPFGAPKGPANGSLPIVVVRRSGGRQQKDVVLVPATLVSGSVVDAGGHPVSGATVEIEGGDPDLVRFMSFILHLGGSASTDESGRFELEDVRCDRTVTLSATSRAGLHGDSPPIVPRAGEPVKNVRIELGGSAVIEGTVVRKDGSPVEGAEIRIVPDDANENNSDFQVTLDLSNADPSAVSDAQGRFRVTSVPPGRIAMDVRADGLRDLRRMSISVENGATKDLGAVVMGVGLSIAGKVTDAGGRPLAGVEVMARRALSTEILFSATTGADGAFRLDHLPAGSFLVQFRDEGFVKADRTVSAGTHDLDVKLAKGRAIAGVLVDYQGRPISKVQIELVNRQGVDTWVSTDDGGRFSFPDLPKGAYSLVVGSASDSDPSGPRGTFTVLTGVAAGTRDMRIESEKPRSIVGVVLGPDGEPVSGATLTARPVRLPPKLNLDSGMLPSASTDRAGRFSLNGLGRGDFRVSVRASGYLPKVVKDVDPDAGLLGVHLARGLEISGVVVDSAGKPLSGVSVSAEEPGSLGGASGPGLGTGTEASTDALGHFEIGGLAPGKYRISTEGYEQRYLPTSVRQVQAGTSSLTIRVHRGFQVRGSVVDGDGNAVMGASINVTRDGNKWDDWGFSVPPSGNFVIGPLLRDTYHFEVGCPGYVKAHVKDVVSGDEKGLRVVLKRKPAASKPR